MIIQKIFVSYSKKDTKIAKKIMEDLSKNQLLPWIYEMEMKGGTQSLKQIDDALSESDIVLGIITENYFNSFGLKEFYAQLYSGSNPEDSGFIPLFFIPVDEVKSKFMKSIWGIDFTEDYQRGLINLINHLKPSEDSGILLTKIESESINNPFRRARAEVFGNNYMLIARAFAIPEREKYDLLLETSPTFLIGGRGSGKTMLLKSLTIEVQLYLKKVKTFEELKNKGINYFGLYFRLEKGSLLVYDNNLIVQAGFAKLNLEIDFIKYKKALRSLNALNYIDLKSVAEDPILTNGINTAWTLSLN
ncbi:MAG: toll/interleukin-1 receptor domain-containing protein [Promethearchaeota archaeon]